MHLNHSLNRVALSGKASNVAGPTAVLILIHLALAAVWWFAFLWAQTGDSLAGLPIALGRFVAGSYVAAFTIWATVLGSIDLLKTFWRPDDTESEHELIATYLVLMVRVALGYLSVSILLRCLAVHCAGWACLAG